MHELPLVFFTVLSQMAAGTVLISALYYLVMTKSTQSIIQIQRLNVVALVVMGLAMAIASLHLGKPLRALNVIFGIGRSPMSNEIVSFSILFGVTLIAVLLAYFAKPNNGKKLAWIKKVANEINEIKYIDKVIATLLIILSLFFVLMIVDTYMIPTIKNWDTYYTAIQMYTSMMILGGVLTVLIGIRKIGLMFAIIGMVIVLAARLPYFDFLSHNGFDPTSVKYYWWLSQSILLGLALLISLINIFTKCHSTGIYLLTFVLVIIAELCGRITFYNLWAIPM